MPTRSRQFFLSASILLLCPALAFGCIWDSDTLADELQGRSSAFEVITGQVPQHGRAYYAKRLETTLDLLKRAPKSLEVLYDAAGACMRLGEHDRAIQYLERAQAVAPGRYKTNSNLGVAHFLRAEAGTDAGKIQADLKASLQHTNLALAKRPDAHFDAGWLFAKMVQWKQAAHGGATPASTLVGGDYEAHGRSSISSAARKRAEAAGGKLEKDFDGVKMMLTLLRAHPDFADGYVVLGMELQSEWNLNLALWAYVRALELGHPQQTAIHKKIDQVLQHWNDLVKHGQQAQGQRVTPKADALKVIRGELRAAKAWLPAFQKAETAFIAKRGTLPEFKTVLAILKQDGVKRCGPVAAGLIGESGRPGGAWDKHGESQGNAGGPSTGTPGKLEAKPKQSVRPGRKSRAAPGNDTPPVGGPAQSAPRRSQPSDLQAKPVGDAHADLSAAPAIEVVGGQWSGVGAASAPAPAAVGASEANGSERAPDGSPAESPLPWYVWFGASMLVLSLGVVAFARGRTA